MGSSTFYIRERRAMPVIGLGIRFLGRVVGLCPVPIVTTRLRRARDGDQLVPRVYAQLRSTGLAARERRTGSRCTATAAADSILGPSSAMPKVI